MKLCNCTKGFTFQLAVLSVLSLLAFVAIWAVGDIRYAVGWLAAALGFALAAIGWYEPGDATARPDAAGTSGRRRS